MHQTFEELAGLHIDGLYHGAMFLNAGREPLAEDLVLWTLTGAFREFRQIQKVGGSDKWLEGRLVRVFLARGVSRSIHDGPTDDSSGRDFPTDDHSGVPPRPESSSGSMEIDPEALFRAAENMSPLVRAAIWLVIFRRWPYDEASRVLGTDVDGLKGLLRHRHALLAALMRRSPERSGTDHDRRQ